MEFWSVGTEFVVIDKWRDSFPGVYTVDARDRDRIYFFIGNWRTWVDADHIRRPTKLEKALR